jgi:hypothetical protein
MGAGGRRDLETIVNRARVRIAQASRLLEQLSGQTSSDDPGQDPEVCLDTADNLWRQLIRTREDNPDEFGNAGIDGLQAEEVLNRLNDIVYELLCGSELT